MKFALFAVLPILALADTPNRPVESIASSSPASVCEGAPDSRAVVLCLNRDALAMEHAGDFNAAVRFFEQANDVWKRDPKLETSLHGVILSNLGEAYLQLGKWSDSAARFEQALALQQSAFGPDDPRAASSMIRLASAKMLLGNLEDAERLYTHGLDIERRSLPGSAQELSLGLGSYALMKVQQGDLAQAAELAKQSVATGALSGTDTVDYSSNLAILAGVYSLRGEMARATPLLSKAIDVLEQKLGPAHPRLAPLLLNRSMLLASEQKLTLAEADASRAVDLLARSSGTDSVNVAWARVRLASIYVDEEKLQQADAILPEALAWQRRFFHAPNTRLAGTTRELARLRAMQSRFTEACALYREAISMFDAVAPSNPEAGRAMHDYARLLKEQNGSKAEIRRLETRARTILGFRTSAF